MTIPNTPDRTQRHWVDATKVPYIVLTRSFTQTNQIRTGDIAVVYRPKTGALAFGVYADEGPELGEASVKLHREVGNEPVTKPPSIPRARIGIGDSLITVVFPGISASAKIGTTNWNKEILQVGQDTLDKWGGLSRLRDCAN
jgi:hypothetical protein